MTESIHLAIPISETPIAVEHSEDLFDNKLLQSQEQVDTSVSKKTKKQSTASMRKLKAESEQEASNLKASCLLANSKATFISTKEQNITHLETVRIENAKVSPSKSDPKLIDILIKYSNNQYEIPVLHYSIRMGDVDAVTILLKHGANANELSKLGYPLDMVSESSFPMMKLLIEKINVCNWKQNLTHCLLRNSIEEFDLLIDRYKELHPSVENNYWPTVLLNVYNVSTIKFLFDRGADISQRPDLLTRAVKTGDLEKVQIFIKHGIQINGCSVGYTIDNPLYNAFISNFTDIAKELIKAGAVLPSGFSRIVMRYVISNGTDDLLNLLLDLDISFLEEFMIAYGDPFNKISKKYPNVSRLEQIKITPLQLSVILNKISMTQILLEKGADPNNYCLGNELKNPLTLAIESGRSFVELLIEYGAHI